MPKNLHEQNQYRDPQFPFELFTINRFQIFPRGRGYFNLHWHEELQFTLVTKGTVTMQVSGIDYHLTQGQAIFINRGLLHMTTNLSPDGEYVSINFPDKLLSFFPGSRMETDYVLPYVNNFYFPATVLSADEDWQSACLNLLSSIITLYKKPKQEYSISIALTQIWQLMILHLADTIASPSKVDIRHLQRIQFMVTYIHEHYMEDISLSQLAKVCHISKGECCRCFQNMLHTSPKQYLLNYRISKSMELLSETNASVTEITSLTGFNSSSHFIDYFKKITHMTPTEYRKQF